MTTSIQTTHRGRLMLDKVPEVTVYFWGRPEPNESPSDVEKRRVVDVQKQ